MSGFACAALLILAVYFSILLPGATTFYGHLMYRLSRGRRGVPLNEKAPERQR
jgi:hypothetical protein